MTNVAHSMPISQQVEVMLKFLNYEISKVETNRLADQTCTTVLMQKTLVGLLLNMANGPIASFRNSESRNTKDMTFRIKLKEGNQSNTNVS